MMGIRSVFLMIAFCLVFSANGFSQSAKESGQLQVVGTQLCDSAGDPVSLRGMSFGWHNWWSRFYTRGTVNWLVKDWKVDAVRASMGIEVSGGYQSDSAGSVDLIKTIIEAAIDTGIYVIVDWHSHNINQDDAIAFFSYIARTYGHLPNVIYEIFNEPDTETWAEVKAYSEILIDTIRKIDPDNIILVGSPNWDQDLHLVAADPITGYDNIMYTMHFYAATHGSWLRDRCDDAIADGIPIFISESAGCEASGDGPIDSEEWDAYIQWMEKNQLSWFCWSISDKNETSAVVKPSASSTGNWSDTDLSESGILCRDLFQKYNASYEPARIYQAMAKGRRGEDLVIGVIGGSITQGYAASTESNRWANLMTDWWEEKFPSSNVKLVNAGWGGTGSDIGAHRAFDDLFVEDPDFIVIEFSVNDVAGELATKMMEGLVQQAIIHDSEPGIMMLLLKMENGGTAQASHKIIGEHYNIPMIPYADSIDDRLAADGILIGDIYSDGVHPNDVGMAYIADFIKEELDSIYATLPDDKDLPPVNTEIGATVIGDVFSTTYQYYTDNLIPLENNGWNTGGSWTSSNPGDQIDFKVMGNAISLIFTQTDDGNRGRAEVWVDDGPKTIIDCWFNENWGTKYAYALVDEGLDDSYHTLHIRTMDESSTAGNYVQITRIMVAGNIGTTMPIAKTSAYQKGAVGIEATFDGSKSYHPDSADIISYNWAIDNKPAGSGATIQNSTSSVSQFSPDIEGEYLISLVVATNLAESVPVKKTFTVRAANTPPVAVAGNDTMSTTNVRFKLDGTKSYDDDSDPLLYMWELESKPEGSEAYVLVNNLQITQVLLDVEGDYVVSLTVNDSIENSEKSYINITVEEGYSSTNFNGIDPGLTIYPNPVSELLNISLNIEEAGPLNIEIYSSNGTLVSQYSFTDLMTGSNKIVLSPQQLNLISGLHYLRVELPSGITTKKFTVIK